MARGGGSQPAQTAATTAQRNSDTLTSNAKGIFSTLTPALTAAAANPTGFGATTKANMNTASQQSLGGSTAGAVGQGGLLAARTRNAGGADMAISDAVRGAGQQFSENALDTEVRDAEMKEGQKQSALKGLQGIYGVDVGGANDALGMVAPNVRADTEVRANDPWNQFLSGMASAGGQGIAKAATSHIGKGCWIAEAIYGVDDPRTHTVRAWLNGPFRETVVGSLVMDLYLTVGQQVAWVARRSSTLRAILKPLFDVALRKATK